MVAWENCSSQIPGQYEGSTVERLQEARRTAEGEDGRDDVLHNVCRNDEEKPTSHQRQSDSGPYEVNSPRTWEELIPFHPSQRRSEALTAQAAILSEARPATDDGWTFTVSPYFWATGIW